MTQIEDRVSESKRGLAHGPNMRDQIANRIIIVILVLSGQGRARRTDRPALADDAAFEFGQVGDDVEHQRATGRGGVDRLGQRAQARQSAPHHDLRQRDRARAPIGRRSTANVLCRSRPCSNKAAHGLVDRVQDPASCSIWSGVP